MALASAVQGARHTAQQVTWQDQDLSGATLTGRIYDQQTGVGRAIDGVLAVTNAAAGVFTWAYGVADVATAGEYQVQFVATYAAEGKDDKTLLETWKVEPAV